MSQTISCPGPEQVGICVLRGVGSKPIQIRYEKVNRIDFSAGWTATLTVYKPDGTVLFAISSPLRIELSPPTVPANEWINVGGPNTVILDSDFTAVSAPLGNYTYRLLLTPTVGTPLIVSHGPLPYRETAC